MEVTIAEFPLTFLDCKVKSEIPLQGSAITETVGKRFMTNFFVILIVWVLTIHN